MEYTTADFTLEIAGLKTKLRVPNFKGTEGLSQLFGFQLYLQAEGDDIKAEDMLGKDAMLTIKSGSDTRQISGILSRFTWIAEVDKRTIFFAELVPIFWLLTQRFDCRIFQNKSVPEIVSEVINEAGITSDHLDKKLLRGSYPQREYCVQYRESDYNFLARLMEEEGIYFYFDHQSNTRSQTGHHTLVMVDAPSCHKAINGKAEVLFHEITHETLKEETVFEYHFGNQIRPNNVTLRDFNYQKPDLSLQSNMHGKATNLELYDYPGEFQEKSEGDRLARSRFEEMQAQTAYGSGRSNCCRFVPGFLFKLEKHPHRAFNKEYMLFSVQHSGFQQNAPDDPDITGPGDLITGLLTTLGVDKLGPVPIGKIAPGLISKLGIPTQLPLLALGPLGMLSVFDIANDVKKILEKLFGHPDTQMIYSNDFMCLPSQTAFRPPRITYKPAILGPQTATVMGPKDEKCYMDDKGRAKVKFHWDRAKTDDEKRTCWLRVAYPYAGSDHGFQFHPLVGDEVVVTFLEGDPDKPLITGVVYNGKNPPPLKPEDRIENVILTPYQHRLMFSDRETSITLNTGGGKDKKKQTLTMYDADNKYGNAIYLKTSDKHRIYQVKSQERSEIGLSTEEENVIFLNDSPNPGILLRDKTKQLMMCLDSDAKTITIENLTDNQIIIKCQQGNVSVIGGSVDVIGGQVNINGSQSVSIKSDAKVSIEAPMIEAQAAGKISLTASMIQLNAPMVTTSGVVQVGGVVITPTIVATTYTPGAGNII
jgi:uncharacterized protein involved in type VI secretion and phage assembly